MSSSLGKFFWRDIDCIHDEAIRFLFERNRIAHKSLIDLASAQSTSATRQAPSTRVFLIVPLLSAFFSIWLTHC